MRTPDLVASLILCIAAASPAAAQYKWVGPGGEVTYSDQPPPSGVTGTALGSGQPIARRDDAGLPAALRGAASKYPVVLYTTADCTPCQVARGHLSKRGIPFTERTVLTRVDADAYRRLGFAETSFPAVSVGRERSIGFQAGEWDRLLDAAGYPQTSMLPPSYRPQPPTALAEAAAAREARRADDAGGVTESVAQDAPREAAPPRPRAQATRAVPEPPRSATTVRF
jgi:hypothetical protein